MTGISNWIRNIEQHASDNVTKILVGNKADRMKVKGYISLFSLFIILYFQNKLYLKQTTTFNETLSIKQSHETLNQVMVPV